MEGSTISELTQNDSVEAASDPEVLGMAGQGAEEPEAPADDAPPASDASHGEIVGIDGSDLEGTIALAPGSDTSGQIDVYCCNDGVYSVYVYDGGRCDDPATWTIESSARVAQLTCARDVGTAQYVRDPSEESTAAFVIYDAAGNALGCADVAAE